MNDLQNPFRFSTYNTTHDISELLGPRRRVTEIDIKPQEGNIYVHWEYVAFDELLEWWRDAARHAKQSGNISEYDGIMGCVDELEAKLDND